MKPLSVWPIAVLLWGFVTHAADFETFLSDVAQESVSSGVPAELVHRAFDGLAFNVDLELLAMQGGGWRRCRASVEAGVSRNPHEPQKRLALK